MPTAPGPPEFTTHWPAIAALAIFAVAYALVIAEEATQLRKSKPVVVAAGLIWIMLALVYAHFGRTAEIAAATSNRTTSAS